MKTPVFFLLFSLVLGAAFAAEPWPQFRGPSGRGHSTSTELPVTWDASKIVWKASLPGHGQSAPVLWEDRIFLTSASEDGRQRNVVCLSANDGAILWEKSVPCSAPENIHKMNTWATPTCATDGRHVVAFFGPGGLHSFTLDGELEWSLDLGVFPGDWGVAASPIILGDRVIQNCDAVGPSRLVAVDLATGNIAWETPRKDTPNGGWSTPTLIEFDGQSELVLNGEFGVQGYDPQTGAEKWFCEAFTGRGEPIPEFVGGTLLVVNGKPGDLYAVKPGGSGNVTETHRLWHAPRKGGRDLPSPVVVGEYLFVSSMSGVATCYDAKDGTVHYTERLGDGIEIAGAPLEANGLVYFPVVHGGDVIVVRPGKTLEIVARNSIGSDTGEQTFRSSLVPLGDRILLRSDTTLYSIGK